MVFRENTEGLYVGVGGFFKKGTPDEIAVQEDVNSRKGVERIIRYAFEYARQNGLKRVCMSDKSNAMTFAHDLWQRVSTSPARICGHRFRPSVHRHTGDGDRPRP